MESGIERTMTDLIRDWDGLGVVVRYDRPSESWFFVAFHDDTLGPPTGGIRMRIYDRPEDGLLDAMRLSRGMTSKWAGVELEFGGGKSVIALSRPLEGEERVEALLRFGRLLEHLRGAYWGGEDLGTSPADMAVLARVTRYVHGIRNGGADVVDPGPYTARGVRAGIQGALDHVFGATDVEGRTVLIQGVGDVGGPLAGMLAERGASLLVSDLNAALAGQVATRTGASVVPPEAVYETPCDVFAPCAVGSILNAGTIPRLRCRIVAGSANNQLGEDAVDADLLRARGIVYVPDYVVNAGGAIALALMSRGKPEAEIFERIEGIRETIREILEEAAKLDESPLRAAERRVGRILARAARG
jgi:leucine dehydrogenase